MLWEKESNDANALYVDFFTRPENQPHIVQIVYRFGQILNLVNRKNGTEKDAQLSAEYRRNGNILFEKDMVYEAMEKYNHALRFAPFGTHHLAFAYANRSACFFRMRMFSESLVDIDLAKAANYPYQLLDKLEQRRTDCINFIASSSHVIVPQIQKIFEPHPKYPSLANMLRIESDEVNGRHIYTTEDLGVGEQVILEKAFISKLISNKYLRCNICLKTYGILVPCEWCTADLFCQGPCQHNILHKYECNMRIYGAFTGVNDTQMMMTRSILLAIETMPDIDELIEFVEDVITSDPMEIPEFEPDDPKLRYRMFLKGADTINLEKEMVVWRVFSVYQTMIKHPEIAAKFNDIRKQRFLMHLIRHHGNVIQCSSSASIENYGPTFTLEVHALVAAFFNHSCAPNVVTMCYDDTIVGIVLRPILAGEQLFISYLGRNNFRSKARRQQYLWDYHGFRCNCERCMLPEIEYSHMTTNPWFIHVMNTFYKNRFIAIREHVDYFLEKSIEFSYKYGRSFWCDEMVLIYDAFMKVLAYRIQRQYLQKPPSRAIQADPK